MYIKDCVKVCYIFCRLTLFAVWLHAMKKDDIMRHLLVKGGYGIGF